MEFGVPVCATSLSVWAGIHVQPLTLPVPGIFDILGGLGEGNTRMIIRTAYLRIWIAECLLNLKETCSCHKVLAVKRVREFPKLRGPFGDFPTLNPKPMANLRPWGFPLPMGFATWGMDGCLA